MTQTTGRLLHAVALLSILAVALALVSQHVFNLRPCAWCVMQRLIYLCVAVVCWLGILLSRLPSLRRLAALVALLLCVGGVLAAWYQYDVAAHLFSCSQTFADRLMVGLGLDAHLPWLFGIFASCMDAQVRILGVEYALWSLGLFCVLGLMSLAALLRRA
ncbi:MAG TPA: disulfide bond formation protein B [Burkholderiaceae bacterium]|nr:disulfide bond formation protein B [Burkholderiaceae bacterium]